MLALTLFLFAVYSSFSFPQFLSDAADADYGEGCKDADYKMEGYKSADYKAGEDEEPAVQAPAAAESVSGNMEAGWAGSENMAAEPAHDAEGPGTADSGMTDSGTVSSNAAGPGITVHDTMDNGLTDNDTTDSVTMSNAAIDSAATGHGTVAAATTDNDITNDGIPDNAATDGDDGWQLILVNKQHPIPENYTFPLGTIKNGMQCDARILDDLSAMMDAAEEDGVKLVPCSPYRDMEYQEMLFNRKINKYMNRGMSYMEAFKLSSRVVTVPGASEHQIGLALDIISDKYTTLDEGFGDTEAGKWLAENSCRYGFILRYPKGKEEITCIEYEPWHFRYVGVDAATVITQEGITLEEFWEEL